MFDSESPHVDLLKNERIKYEAQTLAELRELKDIHILLMCNLHPTNYIKTL